MVNLIRMDLYRVLKSRAFLICLLLTFVLTLAAGPVEKALFLFASSVSADLQEPFAAEVNLSGILSDPFAGMGLMLALISLVSFFHADVENGYIKNIAGQVPSKGLTVVSKFIAAAVHNLIFALAGILGSVIGTLLVRRIVMDSAVLDSLRVFVLKLMLAQSLSALLLLAVNTLRNKSLGMVLAVLFGLGLTFLIYMGISEGLSKLLGTNVDISEYMPDSVMGEIPLDTVKALTVSIVASAVCLIPAVRIFDLKDVR